MKKIFLPLLIVAVLIAACVPSVNPFYFDKDAITDARLVGTWQEDATKSHPETWVFEAGADKSYAATLTDDEGKTGKFDAHLFKLGATTFIDLTPADCDYATNQAGLVGVAMIPGHLLQRVQLGEKKLSVAICDSDWLKKFLEKNPAAIAHRMNDKEIILTAETAALQKFVLKHLGKDELFGEEKDYKKQ
jgi:hypothetical protein